jgi:hypothetical protein
MTDANGRLSGNAKAYLILTAVQFFAVLLGFIGGFFIVGLEGLSLSGNTAWNLLILQTTFI